jgi:uncharacterized repeat protein (TIGR02543 family)
MSSETNSKSAALTANTFTRAGYTFAGWNTVATGGGTAYANGAMYPFSASISLYAQWTLNTPPPPTRLVAFTRNDTVWLHWDGPARTAGSAISGYNIFRGTSSGHELSTPLNGTSLVGGTWFRVNGLNRGVRYFFIVTAVNTGGSSAPSNEISVVVPRFVWTRVSVGISKLKIDQRAEHAVEFHVRVIPEGIRRALGGAVKIMVGSRVLCHAKVSGMGTAHCALPKDALRAGTYRVVAMYSGDSNAHTSTSTALVLTIT